MGLFKKILKGISKLLLGIIIVLLINIIVGLSLIRFEVFPRTQTLIVTSTMTTLKSQYIARIFASEAQIKRIMNENKVEETVEVFDKSEIVIPKTIPPKASALTHVIPISTKTLPIVINTDNSIKLIDIKGDGYKGHMFIVSNPKRVRLAVAKNIGKVGDRLTQLINSENALGGINAGGFTDTGGVGNGGIPTGIIVKNGKVIWSDPSQKKYDIIGIDKDGILTLGNLTIKEIKEKQIAYAISFGPKLIVNNKPTKIIGDGGWGINPRSVIGQKKDGTIILLEIDGRQLSSHGATIREVQRVMIQYGAVNAANLDGGSSSTIYYKGQLINSPCSIAGERTLPDAFVITK